MSSVRIGAALVVSLLTAACAPSPSPDKTRSTPPAPQPAPVTAPVPLPAVDVGPLRATMEHLITAYNKGTYSGMTRYLGDAVIAKCGGKEKYAQAGRQNALSEELAYTVDDVEVTGGSADAVEADVTISSRDIHSGKSIDDHLALGFTFSRAPSSDTRWVLDDAFPVGLPAFCK